MKGQSRLIYNAWDDDDLLAAFTTETARDEFMKRVKHYYTTIAPRGWYFTPLNQGPEVNLYSSIYDALDDYDIPYDPAEEI